MYMICVYLVYYSHSWYTLPFWVTFIALSNPDPFLLLQEPNTTSSLKPGVAWWFTALYHPRCENWTRWTFLWKTTHHPCRWDGLVFYTDVPKKIRYVFTLFSIIFTCANQKGRDPRSFVPTLVNPFKLCAMSLLSAGSLFSIGLRGHWASIPSVVTPAAGNIGLDRTSLVAFHEIDKASEAQQK